MRFYMMWYSIVPYVEPNSSLGHTITHTASRIQSIHLLYYPNSFFHQDLGSSHSGYNLDNLPVYHWVINDNDDVIWLKTQEQLLKMQLVVNYLLNSTVAGWLIYPSALTLVVVKLHNFPNILISQEILFPL